MTKTTLPPTSILALVLLALTSDLRADDPTPQNPGPSTDRGAIVSVGAGAGTGAGASVSGDIVGLVSIQARRGGWLFGARMVNSSEFDLFGPSPALSATEYSVLIGRHSRRKAGYLSASTGLALVRAVSRGRLLRSDCSFLFCSEEYEKVVGQTVGVPFELKAVLSSRNLGLGISILGDVNPKRSFVGAALTVELGSLR